MISKSEEEDLFEALTPPQKHRIVETRRADSRCKSLNNGISNRIAPKPSGHK
jgi:hypothetical protein